MKRYKKIIPDWDEFVYALEKPLPDTIRVNQLRISPESLKKRLEEKGFEVEIASWCPYLFTVRGTESLGHVFEYWQGYYYIQESSSMLAVLALDPEPGEIILDACAAPGGKTTHIAELMENKGTIIANDLNHKRAKALGGNLSRLGILNTFVSNYNGVQLPEKVLFDKILLDAPCSAEGNARREPRLRKGAKINYIRRISRLQEALLLKMIDLLKPDGILVYSTCTFAPEENEMVIQSALEKKNIKLEPIHIPVSLCPGLMSWEGNNFHSDMDESVRMYPHKFDSGGGFVAKIRKLSNGEKSESISQPSLTQTSNEQELIEYYEKRFGVHRSTFDEKEFIRKSKYIWMTTADVRMLELFPNINSFGLKIAGLIKKEILRPTDWGLVWLNGRIKKNRIELSEDIIQTVLLSKGTTVSQNVDDGFVALCFKGEVIGNGTKYGDMVKCKMQTIHKNGIFESIKREGLLDM